MKEFLLNRLSRITAKISFNRSLLNIGPVDTSQVLAEKSSERSLTKV